MKYANTRAAVAQDADAAGIAPCVYDLAILDELRYVRRAAQAEANLAYRDWSVCQSGERYIVFRAAQDRADAAHDELANWARTRLTAAASA